MTAASPPVHVHGPRARFGPADIRELWEYRDLFTALVGRELRVRYRQVLIGAAWAVVQPIAKLAIFALLIVRGLGAEPPVVSGVPYLVTAYVGLICWQLLSTSLRDATHVLIVNREMITKVYFPRLLLPAVPVAVAAVDFAVSLIMLVPLMLWGGVGLSWTVVFAPLVLAGLLLVALAGAVWLSGANALYRDIGYTVPLMLDVGIFATPVFYETAAVITNSAPAWVLPVYSLNPAAGLIELFRWSLWGSTALPTWSVALSLFTAAGVLAGGVVWFHRVENELADRV